MLRALAVPIAAALLTAGSSISGVLLASRAVGAKVSAPVTHRVTAAGQDLYEYEALLDNEFGPTISVCTGTPGCRRGWFYRGALTPEALYSVYTFTFNDFGRSTFHLMPAGFAIKPGAFGNYPAPVTVNGRYVACDGAANRFLIAYGDAAGAGNLACLAPQFSS